MVPVSIARTFVLTVLFFGGANLDVSAYYTESGDDHGCDRYLENIKRKKKGNISIQVNTNGIRTLHRGAAPGCASR